MAKIYFIRHGQASFFKDNYDQLSPTGIQQAKALKAYFQQSNHRIDRFISGDLQRQVHTKQIVSSAYSEPALLVKPSFNEHQGPQVVRSLWPKEVPVSPSQEERKKFMRAYFRFFEDTTKEWVLGKIPEAQTPGIEPWKAFSQRVHEGLEQVLSELQKGESVAVVTSGGPVSVAVGKALNLTDEKIIELSWNIANSSITEFLYSNGRFSLSTFNTTPHLQGDLQTLV